MSKLYRTCAPSKTATSVSKAKCCAQARELKPCGVQGGAFAPDANARRGRVSECGGHRQARPGADIARSPACRRGQEDTGKSRSTAANLLARRRTAPAPRLPKVLGDVPVDFLQRPAHHDGNSAPRR